jgi:hypothetical protein
VTSVVWNHAHPQVKVDTFSSFVIVTAAIIVALTIAWFVYGT